jgi:aspartate dehydrogenase
MTALKKLKIGLVGCGAIGSSLAKCIVLDFSDRARLVGVNDLDIKKAYAVAKICKKSGPLILNLEDLIKRSDLIIEATQTAAAFGIAKKVIEASCDIMVMSVGGILKHYRELAALAQKKGARLFIPSGAISGIDGLKAASCGKIKKVTLITTKPKKAFSGVAYVAKKNIRLDDSKGDVVLFEGNASAAIKAFPQNVNVSATLSLGGIGPEKTRVRVIASDKISRNIHQIEIESDSGKIICRTENVIHPDNPKTSYLAALSAVATLRQILDPVKIGT